MTEAVSSSVTCVYRTTQCYTQKTAISNLSHSFSCSFRAVSSRDHLGLLLAVLIIIAQSFLTAMSPHVLITVISNNMQNAMQQYSISINCVCRRNWWVSSVWIRRSLIYQLLIRYSSFLNNWGKNGGTMRLHGLQRKNNDSVARRIKKHFHCICYTYERSSLNETYD
jgi:hypothetical protein